MDGVIFVDKPAHMTSFGVVARVRRVLSEGEGAKVKVGHTGTLDPFATGLMILVVGKATKRAVEYSKLDKVYEATIELGYNSSTGDPEGEMTKVGEVREISRGEIEQVLGSFVGEITQVPPVFSAIKIGGERAYKLARRGEEVKMPERCVTIYSIELLDLVLPFLKIRVHVSSGTYIRSLAEDIGKKLGVGAYVTELRRIKVGEYELGEVALMSVPE
ncbi:MAG: tRNA pseudouridine(55) synthase TruB [Candidatus Nomurabacteria bacterium]|jgi:tRNA pseudouridine55 synthase|nr:tRNA pseudouridine(55) synthase TruB [Candidatus Nomurabacteria bacterium]